MPLAALATLTNGANIDTMKIADLVDAMNQYTYRVVWSKEDEEFVGLCAEFPSLSWLEPDRHDALDGITRLVAEVVQDMRDSGETVPVPLTEKNYSGSLRVRMPPVIHQRLALQAAEEGTSLNAVIVRCLSK